MPLSQSFPGHNALATFADVRRDLEGAVVRNAAGKMRAGVFYAHGNKVVNATATMRAAIGDFRFVQDRSGAIFGANVGTTEGPQHAPAPTSNRRIDLIYVTQESTTLGDTASLPMFGIVQGAASATPTVPALPANRADAIPLATVEIPAGATALNSTGVVITDVFPYTAMAGGTVVVRNSVELSAWTPASGSRAFNLADNREYVRSGAAWNGDGQKLLWSHPTGFYLNTQTLALAEPVSKQQHGIVLQWGRYNAPNAPTSNHQFTHIPKAAVEVSGGINCPLYDANVAFRKYVYVTDDSVSGLASNGEAPANTQVIWKIYGY